MASKVKGCSKATLDKLWATRVKEKAHWRCEICGSDKNLAAHHYSTRHNHSVRWYIPNGVCLCDLNCHQFGPESAHKNPAAFTLKMISLRGTAWLEQLSRQSATPFSWKKEMTKIRAYLDGEISNYVEEVK